MKVVKCGYDVWRNDEEKSAFEKFLPMVESLDESLSPNTKVDDQMCMRFLRARALDKDKALDMLTQSLGWRQENKVDTFLNDYRPKKKEIKLYVTGGLHKCDKDGDLLWIDRMGQVDGKGLVKAFGSDEIVRYEIFRQEKMQERFEEESKKQGRLVDRLTAIQDLSGLGVKHLNPGALKAFKMMVKIGTDNYPERLKRCFLINAPPFFPKMWNTVKGYFDPRTQKKITVLGTDYLETLKQYIPEENIPAFLGGQSKIGDDTYCKQEISPGGYVPEHLYLDASDDESETEKSIVVKAGTSHFYSVEAGEGTTLKWSFKIESKDIEFSLNLHKEDGNEEAVVEKSRQKADGEWVDGQYTCSKSGTYVFKWDNSYSWTKQKSLSYKIEVDAS